ncbi:MAG TPA: hypothetical protein DCS93_43530 [Microscillaceae bacterium]|nr:hypothetical protein [Microscillaceae bacterium]
MIPKSSILLFKQGLSLYLRNYIKDAYYYTIKSKYAAIYRQDWVEKCDKLLEKIKIKLQQQYQQIVYWPSGKGSFAFDGKKFGYFDASGDQVISYVYDFVELEIHGDFEYFRAEKNGQRYLVFLSGEEYTLANTIEELMPNTEAVAFYSNPVFNDFSALSKYRQIKVLILDYCGLDHIPYNLGSLKSIEKVSLAGNNITSFPSFIFQLKKVKELSLSENPIQSIPEKVLNLNALESLWLDHCLIGQTNYDNKPVKDSISPISLSSLQSLSSISICSSGLKEIPDFITSVPYLKTLKLSSNQINDTTAYKLSLIKGLETLDLAGNEISTLPDKLYKLKKLNLSHNQLTKVTNAISSLLVLEYLNLSNNQITHISNDIKNLVRLKKIDISNNLLTNFPNFFSGTNIKIQNDEFNKKASEGIEHNPTLEEKIELSKTTLQLNLSFEGLDQLPFSVDELNHIEELNLSYNRLNTSFTEICKLTKLKKLDFSGNQITDLPIEINKLKNLEELTLNENRLSSLPETFRQLNRLCKLDLSVNQFIFIPQEIFSLDALSDLNLFGNLIKSYPNELINMPCLNRFTLSDNDDWLQFKDFLSDLNYECEVRIFDDFGNDLL